MVISLLGELLTSGNCCIVRPGGWFAYILKTGAQQGPSFGSFGDPKADTSAQLGHNAAGAQLLIRK